MPAGDQHVAAGHADRTAPRTHVVGAGELRAALGQSIEIRCVDVSVAQVCHRLVALVVGEDEKHVRLGLRLRLAKRKTKRRNGNQAAREMVQFFAHKSS